MHQWKGKLLSGCFRPAAEDVLGGEALAEQRLHQSLAEAASKDVLLGALRLVAVTLCDREVGHWDSSEKLSWEKLELSERRD